MRIVAALNLKGLFSRIEAKTFELAGSFNAFVLRQEFQGNVFAVVTLSYLNTQA